MLCVACLAVLAGALRYERANEIHGNALAMPKATRLLVSQMLVTLKHALKTLARSTKLVATAKEQEPCKGLSLQTAMPLRAT